MEVMNEWQHRSVLEMLDTHIQIERWDNCTNCNDRKRVAGGGKGLSCPQCHAIGQVPITCVSGLWHDDG